MLTIPSTEFSRKHEECPSRPIGAFVRRATFHCSWYSLRVFTIHASSIQGFQEDEQYRVLVSHYAERRPCVTETKQAIVTIPFDPAAVAGMPDIKYMAFDVQTSRHIDSASF